MVRCGQCCPAGGAPSPLVLLAPCPDPCADACCTEAAGQSFRPSARQRCDGLAGRAGAGAGCSRLA